LLKYNPKVSVIMPAYNSGPYIGEAIESILSQTFSDFEFIIINDGSTDEVDEVIRSFNDPRIIYYSHKTNLGSGARRNEGLNAAKGNFIVLMDSDDITPTNRLQIQFDYLESHPMTDILGGSMEYYGNVLPKKVYLPTDSIYINAALFFKDCISQSTTMFRRLSFEKHHLAWKPEWEYMEDYELWYNASLKGLKMENLPHVLLKYRQSEIQSSKLKIDDRVEKLKIFFSTRLHRLGVVLNTEEQQLLFRFIRTRISFNQDTYKIIKRLLNEIEAANKKAGVYPHFSFKSALLFYRFRLGKYYFLENRKNYFLFFVYATNVLFSAGRKASILFYSNERRGIFAKE
jgi:glycosyltransferase involved in cell wall biosynthesis